MRDNVKLFVKLVSETFTIHEPIVEIGSLQVRGQEGYSNLREFFSGKSYVGTDIRDGLGVDRIENVENLSFNSGTVGTVICVETLEHVQDPIKALDEIYRVLKPKGLAVLASSMDYPIHDFPADYWRFTPEGFNLLLRKFPTRIIGKQGWAEKPHTVFGLGFKQESSEIQKRFGALRSKLLNKSRIGLDKKRQLFRFMIRHFPR